MRVIFFLIMLIPLAVGAAGDSVPMDGKPPDLKDIEEKKSLQGLLLPFPLLLTYTRSGGLTNVTVYDNNNNRVAEGSAILVQNRFSITGERLTTGLYITPDLGYFNRTVSVKDFSKKDDEKNSGIIGGIITDPVTGEVISQEDVYSLKYRAEFHSFFIDIKAGVQIVSNEGCAQFTVSPYVSANAAEYRKTVFRFKTSSATEKFTLPYDFSYFSSYGFGVSLGFFFPATRAGFSLSYDRRFFSKYLLPSAIRFKESYYDDTFHLVRSREVSVKYSDIEAHIFSFIIYFAF